MKLVESKQQTCTIHHILFTYPAGVCLCNKCCIQNQRAFITLLMLWGENSINFWRCLRSIGGFFCCRPPDLLHAEWNLSPWIHLHSTRHFISLRELILMFVNVLAALVCRNQESHLWAGNTYILQNVLVGLGFWFYSWRSHIAAPIWTTEEQTNQSEISENSLCGKVTTLL